MAPLKYKSLELQEYLKCKNLTEKEKKLLHMYRTRMAKLPNNFGQKKSCPACDDPNTSDNQENLLLCPNLTDFSQTIRQESYEDIFSEKTDNMKVVLEYLEKGIAKREKIVDANIIS